MSTRSWFSEENLVDELENLLLESLSACQQHKAKIIREVDTGLGRADMLCIYYDTSRLLMRKNYFANSTPIRPLTNLASQTLAIITGSKWINLSDLQSRLKVTATTLDNVVSLLSERKLIEIRKQKINIMPSSWFISDIIAYEAKLSKWKEVIEQAFWHRWFASKSFVVMPKLSEHISVSLKEKCSLWNIGVMLYHDNTYTIEIEPTVQRLPATPLGWRLNERIFDEEVFHVPIHPKRRSGSPSFSSSSGSAKIG